MCTQQYLQNDMWFNIVCKWPILGKVGINAIVGAIVELESDYPVWLSGRLDRIWSKLTHCPSPTGTSDSGQSIDNTRISNMDLIVSTTYVVQRDSINTRRSRKLRMQKIPLSRDICLYGSRGTRGSLINVETKVVSHKRVGGTRHRGVSWWRMPIGTHTSSIRCSRFLSRRSIFRSRGTRYRHDEINDDPFNRSSRRSTKTFFFFRWANFLFLNNRYLDRKRQMALKVGKFSNTSKSPDLIANLEKRFNALRAFEAHRASHAPSLSPSISVPPTPSSSS